MRASRIIPISLLVVFVTLTSVCLLSPSSRPGFVRSLLRSTRGYHSASEPEEALEKFHKAIGERDYETAGLYCSGAYHDYLNQAGPDAKKLGDAIDNLRHVMKSKNIKSDKADLMLFWLDPFPSGFGYKVAPEDEDGRTWGVLSWPEDKQRFRIILPELVLWRLGHVCYQPLLPIRLVREDTKPEDDIEDGKLDVELVEEDGSWKIAFPIKKDEGRNLGESIPDFLQRGPNITAGLEELKAELKSNAFTVPGFEEALRKKIRESEGRNPSREDE